MRPAPKPVTVRCPAFVAWIKTRRCLITGRHGVDPCHIRTKRNHGDVANVLPLTHHLHVEQHQIGIRSFAEKYGLDLQAEAQRLWAEWTHTEEGKMWVDRCD